MAVTIDWPTQVINIPRDDLLLVQSAPTEIRELDIDAFRLELKSIEASIEGMPFVDTHSHNPPVTVGGVTLARVVEIINGYTITFEDGQYAVNLAGANSNIGDVTNVNQVSVRSANSAGLTYSKEVEDQSFSDARVWVDSINGTPGTQFPRGTPGDPTDSIDDGISIITARGLPQRLHLRGSFILNSSDDLSNYDIEAASPNLASIDIGAANTNNTVFSGVSISGINNGAITTVNTTSFSSLSEFNGTMLDGGLKGTITLADTTDRLEFTGCHSHVAGINAPIIDCQNINNLDLQLRDYTGGIELTNIDSSGANISIDLNSGHVILDSSVVNYASMVIRGTGYVTNYGSTTPDTEGLSADKNTVDIIRKIMTNRIHTDPLTGVLTIWDDDDSTILYSGNIYEDVGALQAYRSQGLERRNKLT